MSVSDFFSENSLSMSGSGEAVGSNKQKSSRQSLKAKFDRECALNGTVNEESSSQLSSRSGSSWCDALSLPNVNAKQAWKSGTEKISQTFNNVRTTFGVLSQKIKKSSKRRQPLINIDSPKTPVTPYTRSKAVLGRTPTKLYSPFHIDTPKGKENVLNRASEDSNRGQRAASSGAVRRKAKQKAQAQMNVSPENKLSQDLLQAQIGIYEFQSVANRIVLNGMKE